MVNGAYHGPGILERGDRAALHTRTTAMHRRKAAAMASLNIFFFFGIAGMDNTIGKVRFQIQGNKWRGDRRLWLEHFLIYPT